MKGIRALRFGWVSPIAVVGILTVAGSVFAQGPSDARQPDKLWRLIASSGAIVRGELRLPESGGKPDLTRTNESGYVFIRLRNSVALKGDATNGTVSLNHYPDKTTYNIEPAVLESLHGKDVVAFLVSGDEIVTLSFPSPWFLQYGKEAVAAATPELVDRIRAEIGQQNEMLKLYPKSAAAKPDEYDQRVKQMIDKFLTAERQRSFGELERLGWPAVPAIIRHLDDRRALPHGQISLANPPGHWEGVRHYGVDNVLQALDAILEQITHASFGHCYNSNRRAEPISRDGWRLWLMYGFSENGRRNER